MKSVLALMVLLTACGGGDSSVRVGKTITNETYINYTIESSSSQIGINTEQLRVLKNQAELDNLLAQTTLMGNPPIANFSTEQLIAIFISETINGCGTKIAVNSVIQKLDSVFVYINKLVLGNNKSCVTEDRDHRSYVIIKIPRVNKSVSLIYNTLPY